MTTPESDPRAGTLDWMPGTASIRWILFVGLLLVAAIAASVHWAIDDFRERALRNGERELRNTALLLARHFDREFEDFIADEKEILSQLDQVSSDSLASSEIHRLLRSKASGIGDIHLFDPTGVLIASSRSWPAPNHRLDEAEVQRLQARSIGGDREIHLARDAFYGDGTLLFVQNRYGRNGAFAGVITRAVSLAWYERFFASVALGDKSAVTMFRSDGLFMARYPAVPSALGQNFKKGLLERQFAAAEVTLRVPSPFDGEERLASAHSLVNAPVTLVASRSVDSILADWREQTTMLVSAAIAAVVVIAGMLFLFGRHLRTRQEATRHRLKLDKQRLDLAINNMTQGLSLFDAAGRLVICNRRYLEIYRLPADIVRPGISAKELAPYLLEGGASEQQLAEYRSFVATNRFARSSIEMELRDGAVLITREPLQGGGWLTTHEDITERKRAYARIAYLAHYDELTALPNRSSFREYLETALASSRDGGQVALLYIDIDEFKGVNDALGQWSVIAC
jgi:PAS domain-containing protein